MSENSNITHTSLSQIYSLFNHFMTISILLLFLTSQALILILARELDPMHRYYFLATSCVVLVLLAYFLSKPSPVYLVDFSCLKPPDSCRVSFSTFAEHTQAFDFLDEESASFMYKILKQSGQGENTYLPPALHSLPMKSSHHEAIQEASLALFPVFESLLSKTKTSPSDIDILIVNCSGFSPSPSLSSIVVNKYALREDVKSFTITGMGCGAGAIAVDMAQNMMKTHRDCNAVILSTEILSTGWYPGKDKKFMVLNCIFRWGAAAVLVTNRKEAKKSAKYKLVHSLRTQTAFDDKGYYSAFREEDDQGLTGVTLGRDMLQAFGESLQTNIALLGTKILPYTEIARYAYCFMKKKYYDKSTESYVPNFKKVVQHFCLPASSRPIIREIGKGLKLGEKDMEPALMTLHRFGNQSSSSLWYELGYIEAKEMVKKGDMVWLLGLGSGQKCNSLVWECIRPIIGEAHRGVWADSIDKYPVLSVDS